MRDVNIIDFRKSMAKELESLPFRIVKRSKVLAVVNPEDKTDELQTLNKELEVKQALIEKLQKENANLAREKHSDAKPKAESLNIEIKTDWGDLRERLGHPRVMPDGTVLDRRNEDYRYSQEAKVAAQDKKYMKSVSG